MRIEKTDERVEAVAKVIARAHFEWSNREFVAQMAAIFAAPKDVARAASVEATNLAWKADTADDEAFCAHFRAAASDLIDELNRAMAN